MVIFQSHKRRNWGILILFKTTCMVRKLYYIYFLLQEIQLIFCLPNALHQHVDLGQQGLLLLLKLSFTPFPSTSPSSLSITENYMWSVPHSSSLHHTFPCFTMSLYRLQEHLCSDTQRPSCLPSCSDNGSFRVVSHYFAFSLVLAGIWKFYPFLSRPSMAAGHRCGIHTQHTPLELSASRQGGRGWDWWSKTEGYLYLCFQFSFAFQIQAVNTLHAPSQQDSGVLRYL